MANDKTETQPTAAAAAPGDTFALPLSEFCTRLSSTDKRVELIGAFNYVETQADRIKDTEANYRARFLAFTNQPA